MEKQELNRMGDVPTVADKVVEEISNIVEGSFVSKVDENTIQIIKDDVISSVRVRPNNRGSGDKITHSGKGSHYEDSHAIVIGEVYNDNVTINKNKIKKIVSETTDWDRLNIAEALKRIWEIENKDDTDHPSIWWIRASYQNGIGISVEIAVPNNKEWESMKKTGCTNTKHCIPSGKIVMKIVAESDVDVEVDDGKVRVHGTVEQVTKIVKKITGNPMEW